MQNLILNKRKTYALLPSNRIIDSLYYFESFFSNLPSNKNFLMLQIHEKYYILQITFRHMFIICFDKCSNFLWAKTDYEFKSYQSPYFKRDYYLDFGSKITNCKNYSRYLFLKKFDKKKKYFHYSCDELVNLININYHNF